MSDDYEDYNYEDDSVTKGAKTKKILIIVLLVVAIIIIIVLLKSCGKGTNKTPNVETEFNYEDTLLEAGKKYFDYNENKLPTAAGECTSVDLNTLGTKYGLVKTTDFEKCDATNTIVQVCMLESGTLQWTPWLSCTDRNSESLYDKETEGKETDLVKDVSLVSFKFLPQVLKENEANLGSVEELWKEDIKYTAYKTLATTKYYRYKDQKWIWNTITKTYYSSTGDKSSAGDVIEYYPSTPNSKYNLSEAGTTAYKWYVETGTTKEYYMRNGSKAFSTTAPEGYPYKGTESSDAKIVYVSQERTVETTQALYYYACKTSATSTITVYQQVPCSNGEGKNTQNPSYTYTVSQSWGCPDGYEAASTPVQQGTTCKRYSDWSKTVVSDSSCTNTELRRCGQATYYAWYKLVSGGTKTYYPSSSSTASGEKIYYVSAPVDGAVKDDSTATKAYKWYYKTEGETSDYLSESPSAGATKTSKTKTDDWSEWSDVEPESKDYRQIDTPKIKIKLQEIKSSSESDWEDLSTEYLTEEELIKLLKDKGYDVETLSDITNNGNIRYKIQMFIRNKKKEVQTNE